MFCFFFSPPPRGFVFKKKGCFFGGGQGPRGGFGFQTGLGFGSKGVGVNPLWAKEPGSGKEGAFVDHVNCVFAGVFWVNK